MDTIKKITESRILKKELYSNPSIPQDKKEYIRQLLKSINVTDIFIGNPRAYSGYRVLVIAAKSDGLTGFRIMGGGSFVPAKDEDFFIEVGVGNGLNGEIEVSDNDCNPRGYVEVI